MLRLPRILHLVYQARNLHFKSVSKDTFEMPKRSFRMLSRYTSNKF